MRMLWPILLCTLFAQQKTPGVRVLGESILQGPSEMYTVAFSHDNRLLAAGMAKQGVVVWDLDRKKEIRKIAADDPVTDLRFLSDGSLLFMMTGEAGKGATTLWNLKKNEKTLSFATDNYLGRFDISPDEKTLYTAGGTGVRIWDLKTGKELNGIGEVARTAANMTFSVQFVAVSPDGTQLACADKWRSSSGVDAPSDNRVRVSVWDLKTRKEQHGWFIDSRALGWGGDLRWLADGKNLLISGSEKSTVVEAAGGKVLSKFDGRAIPDPTMARAFTTREKECASWDLSSGAKVGGFPIGAVKHILSAAVSRDGRWLAGATMSQTALLIDLKEKTHVSPVDGAHQRQPAQMFYSADGRLLVFDGASTRTYDESGRLRREFVRGWYYVEAWDCLAPDGRLMLIGGGEDGHAELWDTVRGERLGRLGTGGGSHGGVQALHLSSDCKWAATAREYSGRLQFHELATGQCLGSFTGPVHEFFGPVLHLKGCVWSASGDRVYISCENSVWFTGQEPKQKGSEGLLSFTGVFDPRTGKLIHQFKDGNGTEMIDSDTILLHEAGDLVYLAGRDYHGLWKASDGKWVRHVESPGKGARFSADGKRLIGNDAIVNVATGKVERQLNFGSRRVTSPSGTMVAALDDSMTIHIFDVKSGVEVAQRDIPGSGKILDVVWHPSELQFAAVVEKCVAAFQVDVVVPAAGTTALNALIETISDKDVRKRMGAAAELAGRQGDLAAFKKSVEAEKGRRDLPRLRMMVLALESLGQREFLESLAKETGDTPLREMAADAALRMKAAADGAKLRAAYEKAEPIKFEWK